jgi:D-serine deaminase-like pyridoxal phosphate-dependent protein
MDDFSHLNTPAFLVDKAVVQRNCDRMRLKAAASNVIFRPHVKTHKVPQVARMQHGGDNGPITVSTLAEAERFAAEGFSDITYAVPVAPEKLERATDLARRVERLNLLIDSFEALQALEERGQPADVFLKVDCGYHRAGVDPDAASTIDLAKAVAASKFVKLHGLLTHAGHSYNARTTGEIMAIAEQERSAVHRLCKRLGGNLVRSVGSTPTMSVVRRFEDVDEVRPGNYVFYDAFQAAIGSCEAEDVAVSVLTTVVGSYPDRAALIVDAGALALSKDIGPDHVSPGFGFGLVCDLNLRPLPMKLIALSQEHGKVSTQHFVPVGTRLRIVPNHSCLTAAMFDRYHVIRGREVTDEWKPVRGW